MKMAKKRERNRTILERLSTFLADKEASVVGAAAFLSIILAASIGIGYLTPLLNTLALYPFFFSRLKKREISEAFALALRWTILTFLAVALVSVFVPDRAERIFAGAGTSLDSFTSWLQTDQGTAPYPPSYMVRSGGFFVASSLATAGLAGIVSASIALGSYGFAFTQLLRHGDNIVHVGPLALLPWVIIFFASMLFFLPPIAAVSLGLYRRHESPSSPGARGHHYLYIGLGLFLAALVLRMILPTYWASLLAKCTYL